MVKARLEQEKAQLEQTKIFNGDSSFSKLSYGKYYQNQPNFNGVYSRNNLSTTKNGAYVINSDEFK